MTFNANIPTINTTFDQWQILFLANFSQMSTAFNINHLPLDDPSKSGNHTIIQLLEQSEDAKIQTNVSEFGIFAKDVEGQTDQTFFQYQRNSTPFQYTNYQIYSLKPTKTQEQYFTIFPGNLIIYFGTLMPDKSNSILLSPGISKNLVSASFTPIDNTQPFVVYTEVRSGEKDVFITALNLFESHVHGGSKTIPKLYYFIVANI